LSSRSKAKDDGEEECSMCRPHFRSMTITEDVRKYAVEYVLTSAEAIESGMQEKGKKFREKRCELFAKA
jgi:phosphomethylpyrimidine synthase